MSGTHDITASLARFAAELRWKDLPENVRHEAKRSLLNFFGTALAGCREEPIEIALQSLAEFSGRTQGTVIGRVEKADHLGAAFLNAASGNIFDFDDTHLRTVIHPTAPIAPALLSLAEMRRVSGPDLLLGFILGVEIACRIGNAISPGHYRKGWHITSTCGIFGAAVGAGKLLELGADRMAWAIGNAATQSAGSVESLGTPAKSIGVGNAARNGLWSALLTEKGFSGPECPIEGKQGFLHAMGEVPDWAALTGGLGETWEILQNTYKPYPCGIVIHPAIDCVLQLRAEHTLAPEQIERIVVRGNPLLSERTDRPQITTGRESQVSVQHSVAVALLFGKAGLEQYTDACVRDPAVTDLRRKVKAVRDPAIAVEAAAVQVFTTDGREHTLSVPFARGSAQRPLTESDLEEKFTTLAAGWQPHQDIRPLIEAIWSLDRSGDAGSVMALTVPRG